MKHTPGPWGAGFGRYIPITAMVAGKSAQIGRAESFGQISDAECEANAAVMIAAPGMLAALKDIAASKECCHFCGCAPHQALCVLTEIIAKAEGRA